MCVLEHSEHHGKSISIFKVGFVPCALEFTQKCNGQIQHSVELNGLHVLQGREFELITTWAMQARVQGQWSSG